MTIGIKYQSAKELDSLLNNLGIYPLHVDFMKLMLWGIKYADIMSKSNVLRMKKRDYCTV